MRQNLMIPSWDRFHNLTNFLEHLCGFSGSYGILLFYNDAKYLFVDGRYTLQAKNETTNTTIISIEEFKSWVEDHVHAPIAIDPWVWSKSDLPNVGFNYVENLIDEIWPEHPQKIVYPISDYDNHDSTKIQRVLDAFQEDALLITNPDSLSWIWGKRCFDKPYNPAIEKFAVLERDGSIYEDFDLTKYDTVCVDNKAPIALVSKIKKPALKSDPILPLRAIKNAWEIEQAKIAHEKDGKALLKFFNWLCQEKGDIDEISAQEKLLEFRKMDKEFLGESFPAISGAGPNSAIIHYRASQKTCRKLQADEVYLIDSGGQYVGATTDVTRTLIFRPTKPIDAEFKDIYQRVLKGHKQLMNLKFPKGTTGGQLDAIARQYLWEIHCDYPHGTGHGVGSFLNVHEGPQSISAKGFQHALKPGMIISIEPGYYKEGFYGIRHENLALVVEDGDKWLSFEQLTQLEDNFFSLA